MRDKVMDLSVIRRVCSPSPPPALPQLAERSVLEGKRCIVWGRLGDLLLMQTLLGGLLVFILYTWGTLL